jgi:aerobic C4-dicarboxylate transport protein
VATVIIGNWTDTLDKDRLDRVLAGKDPFDERTMLDEEDTDRPARTPAEDAELRRDEPAKA